MNLSKQDVKYDEFGLVPVVVQDAFSRDVLTLAYMNAESLTRTIETGDTWFWSRSRRELWHKGETSGNTQRVVNVRGDCDQDALLVLVQPAGPACHTGARTCFHHEISSGELESVEAELEAEHAGLGTTLERLYSLVDARRKEMPEGSYTTYLFEKGVDKILKKVGEEATETIIAAKNADDASLAGEVSDLLYHLVVLLVERGLSLEVVNRELLRRGAWKGVRDERV